MYEAYFPQFISLSRGTTACLYDHHLYKLITIIFYYVRAKFDGPGLATSISPKIHRFHNIITFMFTRCEPNFINLIASYQLPRPVSELTVYITQRLLCFIMYTPTLPHNNKILFATRAVSPHSPQTLYTEPVLRDIHPIFVWHLSAHKLWYDYLSLLMPCHIY